MKLFSAVFFASLACFASFAHGASDASSRLAGAVIRSDTWKIHRNLGQEEFTGNVSYRRNGDTFRSDWALWDRKKGTFRAKGNAYAGRRMPSGEVLEAWGGQGRYDFTKEVGWLDSMGNAGVRFRRTSPQGSILNGVAKEARWDRSTQTFTMEKNVVLRGSSETARGIHAAYSVMDQKVHLEGGPPVIEFVDEGFWGILQADEVNLFPDEKRLRAMGGAHGWLLFKQEAPVGK